jgi:hypothetical protein
VISASLRLFELNGSDKYSARLFEKYTKVKVLLIKFSDNQKRRQDYNSQIPRRIIVQGEEGKKCRLKFKLIKNKICSEFVTGMKTNRSLREK